VTYEVYLHVERKRASSHDAVQSF